MGSLSSLAWRGIKWIGNCINTIIKWWGKFKDRVDKKTYNFIIVNSAQILNTQNPIGVGEILAINKEKNQLDEIAEKIYKTLSSSDKQALKNLLDQKNY